MKISRRTKREARRLFRLCLVNGMLQEPRVRHVVQQVVAAGRGDGRAILAHFRRLVRLELAQHTATVESATRLPATLEASIETGLRRRYGPGLTTAFAQTPALIGGMRIQVGSDVFDGSVRAGLAALEKSL
jgi:F-type H+-transporting ATPase subunit delta